MRKVSRLDQGWIRVVEKKKREGKQGREGGDYRGG